jgi:hypothetical protein
MSINRGNYLTVKLLAEKYEAFTEASLRHFIFHEHSNGLHKAIRRVGTKVLIDEDKFIEWIEERNGHDNHR